jgi:hypothetical protein
VGRHRTVKIFTLAVVLGAHLAWLLEWHIPIGLSPNTVHRDELRKFPAKLVPTRPLRGPPAVQAAAPHAPHNSDITKPVSAEGVWLGYKTSDELDTRAAPRIEWNINKQLLVHGESTALMFTVWVSAAGVIEALEPHTRNAEPWRYDGLARALQETLMVPASLRTEPVASTMTVELTVDNDD